MAVRLAQHDGPDAEARDECGQRGERAPPFERRALAVLGVRHEVIRDARDVPAGRLEIAPEVQDVGPGGIAHAREDSETHVSLLFRSIPPAVILAQLGSSFSPLWPIFPSGA